MIRMTALAPGQVLRLVALDPGAPADIPAWCRMTGHTGFEPGGEAGAAELAERAVQFDDVHGVTS